MDTKSSLFSDDDINISHLTSFQKKIQTLRLSEELDNSNNESYDTSQLSALPRSSSKIISKVKVDDDPLAAFQSEVKVKETPVTPIQNYETSPIQSSPYEASPIQYDGVKGTKTESLTIRATDETRIVAAMANAAKRQTTGTVFSVKVDISKTGTLGIGVKDLTDNILAVSMLKRSNGECGAGENAGMRLGDVIFGINFTPTRDGSKTLQSVLKREVDRGRKTVHVQCWRCHQLCSDIIPGLLFPRADDVVIQAFTLYRTKIFSEWERWNFIEILLGYMVEELKMRVTIEVPTTISVNKATRARQMKILDLERNILQAKGLRTALCVRIVHTKMQANAVVYVLRVEDVETGLQWAVHRRYRDFYSLNEELADMSHFTREVNFPKKRLSIRQDSRLVESRIVALEQYTRRILHLLTLYSSMDPTASRSLRHLQSFLGVDKYIDCVHPPSVDDQRYIELMAYRFLNDFNSPACQQCVKFVTNVDLDSMVIEGDQGYKPVLQHISQALSEVESFVLLQHTQQMTQTLRERKPDFSPEQLRTFIRRCVRRQVEAAIFLPLRRTIFRIIYSFIANQAEQLQTALTVLQNAKPEYFMVDNNVAKAKTLVKAIKAFRDVMQAYLPADQGQLLMHAAALVVELHSECMQEKDTQKLKQDLKNLSNENNEVRIKSQDILNESHCEASLSLAAKNLEVIRESPRNSNSDKEKSNESDNKIFSFDTKSNPIPKPNLTGRAILADPVSEMFQSPETLPKRVLEGILPRDRYTEFEDNSFNYYDSNTESNQNQTINIDNMDINNLASSSSDANKIDIDNNENSMKNITSSNSLDINEILENNNDISNTDGATRGVLYEGPPKQHVISADDFLPLFTYILVQSDLPQLLLVKEVMTNLVDDEETYGECGYYMITLEAAIQHINSLYEEYTNSNSKDKEKFASDLMKTLEE